jgi:hypothetical protein
MAAWLTTHVLGATLGATRTNGIRFSGLTWTADRTEPEGPVCKTAGSGPLHVRAANGDGVNRRTGARLFSPVRRRKPQVKSRFYKPTCKPDAAGQAETGEMQKAGDDFTPQVGRGQRSDQRLLETAEMHVGRLITQRRLRAALSRAWHLADSWERGGSERTRRSALRLGYWSSARV